MTMKRLLIFLSFFAFGANMLQAQGVHEQSTIYEYPTDPLVRAKLDKWQDNKFGMIIHWGIYAVPGIVESWSICNEDWIGRDSTTTYDAYKRNYWAYSEQFNPVDFNPDQWAEAAKDAGMNYVVFTTKHHDGFCMWDTKETDFSIAKGPFKNNPKADVTKHVFDAFRKQNFMIGAYFSKPDWHCQYYWWDKYATADRNNNYDIHKNPWRWNKFKEFTFNQISELMHNYGSVDILWLDGGWVRPRETVNAEVLSWGAPIPEWSQDIDMAKIAAMGREVQPGMLVVDRTVHGPFENYQTPEQKVPQTQLPHPWESCITLGYAWSHVPNERYKSTHWVIHTLTEITAKGGSLLLGVGPTPQGLLRPEAIERLKEVGKWTSKNGKAIYGTRITPVYNDDKTWFTQSKDGKTIYAITCLTEKEPIPTSVEWQGNEPAKGGKIVLLQTGKSVKWEKKGGKIIVTIPKNLPNDLPALAFEFKK